MFSHDKFYGHGAILRRYCGVGDRYFVPGLLQHGWNDDIGLPAHQFAEPWPKYVWSARNRDACERAGYRDVVPIGSPFLYLPEDSPPPGPQDRSLLAFPFHGWEEARVAGDLRDYAEALGQLERDGFGPITVCLYWLEHSEPRIRAIFEQRGFSVVTNGHREGDPEFVFRQRASIRSHAFVTSNRVGTAAFYSLFSGRPFFLHGPPTGLLGMDDPDGSVFDAWQRREFPELTYENFDATAHPELGAVELGAEFRRSPEELRSLFGWNTPGFPLGLWRQVQRRWLGARRRLRSVASPFQAGRAPSR